LKKFREIGYGNRWFIRTEFEDEDGTESEVRGFTKPFNLRSVYFRAWIGKRVLIIDTKDGIKLMRKTENKFKMVLGFYGN